MNYTQMFANGGKTSDQELIKGIQKILGVDDSQMEQLLQIGINKYGSLEGIGQALSQATQGLTQNSSPEEVQAAVASVFQTNAESQMFKCGGKLQQLVSKFGKGGNVDCGCSGVKLGGLGMEMDKPVKNGEYTPDDFFKHREEWTQVPMPDGRLGYARNYRKPIFRWFGPKSNTLTQVLVSEDPEDNKFRHSTREIHGFFKPNAKLDTVRLLFNGNTPDITTAKIMDTALEGVAPERPQSKQEGGVMLEQMPGNPAGTSLTRRQSRELSQLNKGYNRAQFQTAMLNAKAALRNQGLRGRELRERAREMVAGVTPVQQHIVPAQTQLIGINTPPEGFGNITPIKELGESPKKPKTQSIATPVKSTNTPKKKGSVEVGNVSILGTPSSEASSKSPVTPIKRSGLNGKAISIDSGKYGIDGMPLGRIYKEYVEEQPHITRTGRDDAGNYYEVSDGMAGINTNGNYYIRRPLMSSRNQNMVPAGGGNFNWAAFKKGGKIDNLACGKKLSCGGKTKAKEGIKLAKCGKKVKK